MATTLTDKIKQITALTKQVKQLQEQLETTHLLVRQPVWPMCQDGSRRT